MVFSLEQIRKLPPKERLQKLKELEEEEKKRKKEAEEIVKKTIEEIAEEKVKEEEEGTKREKEETEKQKTPGSLEEITEKAPAKHPAETQERQHHYRVQQEYAKRPTTELAYRVDKLRESFDQKGYLNPAEKEQAEMLRGAFYQKEQSYKPNEEARQLMTQGERALEEMIHPTRGKKYQ
jgi:hypothetical protein